MAVGWGGQDPVQSNDSDDYEVGTEFRAVVDVTLTKVRVWSDGTEEGITPRVGKIWSTAGVLLGQVTLPDALPSGWSSYTLDAPVTRLLGERFIVSYPTGGRYGIRSGALAADVASPNGALIAVASGSATNGNGVFDETPNDFPTGTFGSTFYGIDVEFDIGVGGAAPVVTGVSLAADGLDVVATITATDVEGLVGATYSVDWGDGDVSSGSPSSFAHTYATEGLKALLISVTDSTDRAGYASAAILLFAGSDFDPTAIIDAVASHAGASGYFDVVTRHEPKNPPGKGLTASIWVQHLGPAPRNSSLKSTTALLVLNLQVYSNMTAEPQDEIDPEILKAVSALMRAYSGNFTLGGLIRNIDLLGMTGQTLRADAGYLAIGGREGGMFRVMVITIPMIISDVWEQSA